MSMRSSSLLNSSSLLLYIGFGIFVFFSCSAKLTAQKFTLVDEIKQIKGLAGIDRLGNIYSLEEGELRKLKPDGRILTYSNPRFGHPTSVDVSNPLNILLFFREFGALLVLDGNLAVKATFLNDTWQGIIGLPSLVSFTSSHGFWAYFPDEFSLVRYDLRGNAILSGTDILAQHPGFIPPTHMAEHGEKLFLSANGIWAFDLFATFLFHIPFIDTESFMIKGDNIFYLSGNNLHVYNFVLEQENVILLPEENVLSFFVENNHLIFLQTNVSLKKFRSTENLY